MRTTGVQTEIQAAVTTLALLSEQFRQLPDAEAERVYRACLSEFVTASFEPTWWWEHLREPRAYCDPTNGTFAFDLLCDLVPDSDSPCYFIAEDGEAPFYPVYLSTPRIAASVLSECYFFEYYITPLDRTWLICETHHDRNYGVGEPVVHLLSAYAATTGNA